MGLGDNLLASGMARGAAARGKRIAFGDGKEIKWDHQSEMIFRGNPNIAPPGSEGDSDLEWINYYRGNRLYNHQVGHRWEWNYEFRAIPGEVFINAEEQRFAARAGQGFLLVEPHVPIWKAVARNKTWPFERYEKVARYLAKAGYDVRQFQYGKERALQYAKPIKTPTFRHALAVLARASLYIGPEGGLHHGAAAVGIAGVVIFGGFIPPEVTGYGSHTNLTGGAKACGFFRPCEHCRAAMDAITVDEVHAAALGQLKARAA